MSGRLLRGATDDGTPSYAVTSTGCWEWQGRIDRNGYGKGYDPDAPKFQRADWAHRISYRIHNGPIPDQHDIDHTCQNTRCVNPEHLESVTRVEHVRRTMARLGKDDAHLKAARLRARGLTYAEIAEVLNYSGRSAAAGAVKSAISKGLVDPDTVPKAEFLSAEDREDIRALYALGIPQGEIGAWYGVDGSQVSRICSGRSSGHQRPGEAA